MLEANVLLQQGHSSVRSAQCGFCVGDDGVLLSAGEAFEKVLAKTPAPPVKPACQGCTAKVTTREPKASPPESDLIFGTPEAAKKAAAELSIYSLEMQGSCDYLSSIASSEKTEL